MASAGATALGAGGLAAASPAMASEHPSLGKRDVLAHFHGLPGDLGLRIMAPPADGDRGLDIAHRSATRMFVGSAFKTFVLCETLRALDAPDVVAQLAGRSLDLNASVWSADSATFNPPNLTGQVSHRTALEAMVMHSDNTGTDMSIKAVGVERIRAFIADAGLRQTFVPDSTRSFVGYLLGAPDPLTFTWEQLQAAEDDPFVNPPLNDVQTLASSADDLVSYYSRALTGAFFTHEETLTEFRRILSLGDAIYLVPLPLGASAFCKGGSIDVPGFHALSVPGGLLFDDRWVFFSATLNWQNPAVADPATVIAFASALSAALSQVKDALAS
jgi:beta-lactamase class A